MFPMNTEYGMIASRRWALAANASELFYLVDNVSDMWPVSPPWSPKIALYAPLCAMLVGTLASY